MEVHALSSNKGKWGTILLASKYMRQLFNSLIIFMASHDSI